ncbi:MAG TPA: methyltransferase domain-containing protein [Thermoplasmata archaeon]|nr:methyltransferase domain-containing protein [Thermoplasmata archaeon]
MAPRARVEYRPGLRDRLRVRGRRKLLERMHTLVDPSGARLLDLGGGTGVTTVAFGAGARERVVLEPNPKKVRRAERAHAPVTMVDAVAESIPFEPGRFDRVTSMMSFHHFSDGGVACREAFRVLSPGGRFVIYDFDRGPSPARAMVFFVVHLRHRANPFRSPAELERLVREAGFHDVRREPFGSGAFVVAAR